MTEEPAERIDPQAWMTDPATLAVVEALQRGGQPVRFVGGCVRDALLGRGVSDVDLATPYPPERAMELLQQAELKVVPTGIEHGTVTAVSGGRPFEVTTLRRDVETFGRHARVAFTDDWRADAARRDFTMNALSCDSRGRVWDYFGGVADARAGRVRFVGSARQRIAEDNLRLLRFFRFLARYGRGQPDAEALEAAAEAAPLLANLSGERVRDELLKLLAASDPVPTLRLMNRHRILATELPEAAAPDVLERLLALRHDADPILRLAALLDCDEEGAAAVAARLRLSNAARDRLKALRRQPRQVKPAMDEQELRVWLYREGRERVTDLLLLAGAEDREPAETVAARLGEVAAWQPRTFPLRGRDLVALGAAAGAGLGALLRELEDWWIARDFEPDKQALLAEARRRLGK